MNIATLCKLINLQPSVQFRVFTFSESFDFSRVEKQLIEFRDYERMSGALEELREVLGEDREGMKILSCMLYASACLHDVTREKGIDDAAFIDTMKCYPRFLEETRRMTGTLCFDRWWWTTRQAGGHLFRIGALEYEMKHTGGGIVIGMHIPSDADFSPASVDASLRMAASFFAAHYPELSGAEYRCHSWLLDPQLREMLSENSHILHFQKRFAIFDEGEASDECIEWLFQTKAKDYAALPEQTSLQRNVRRHLLSGGVIRNAYGRLKDYN